MLLLGKVVEYIVEVLLEGKVLLSGKLLLFRKGGRDIVEVLLSGQGAAFSERWSSI